MIQRTHDPLLAMQRRFDPQAALADVFGALSSALPFDRAGVAAPSPDGEAFRVLALLDRDDASGASRGYSFARQDTVGDWVTSYAMPFVGETIDAVRPHPATMDYMVQERFSSNCVLPLEFGEYGRGVIFLLSRRQRGIGAATMGVCIRLRDLLEPGTRAFLAAGALRAGGDPLDAEAGEGDEPRGTGDAGEPSPLSLDEAQRRHIERVLARTQGVIEGPAGAAHLLGLHPSTLRNRMKRLGVRRRGGS